MIVSKDLGSIPVLSEKFLRVSITPEAFYTITALVKQCSVEVSWYNTGKVTINDDSIYVHLTKTLIPVQEVSASTTEIGNDITRFNEHLKEIEHLPIEDQVIWGYGHSHGTLGVSPSGQDIKQWKEWVSESENLEEAIGSTFMIVNKSGDWSVAMFDGKNIRRVSHTYIWQDPYLNVDEIAKYVRDMLKDRVSDIYKSTKNSASSWHKPYKGNTSTGYTGYNKNYYPPTYSAPVKKQETTLNMCKCGKHPAFLCTDVKGIKNCKAKW